MQCKVVSFKASSLYNLSIYYKYIFYNRKETISFKGNYCDTCTYCVIMVMTQIS